MSQWDSLFDLTLAVTPPLGDEQLALVPAKRGVALLCGAADAPIVLLPAGDMRARIATRLKTPPPEHKTKAADLRQITQSIRCRHVFSHFETDLDYLKLAAAIWPQTYGEMLAWKPACFVYVDPAADFPQFRATRELAGGARIGQFVGPFPSQRAARAFVESLQDAFALCRDPACLRRAPHGQPCAYWQMGRCLGACHGAITMDEYRRVVQRAADFAAGNRTEHVAALTAAMRQHAAELKFEQAAAAKNRLARLGEFDARDYQYAKPLDALRFIIVQAGAGKKKLRVFLMDRGNIAMANFATGNDKMPTAHFIDLPPRKEQLESAVAQMRTHVASFGGIGPFEEQVIGLVNTYLFCGDRRRGLMLPWRDDLAPDELGQAIAAATLQKPDLTTEPAENTERNERLKTED